MGTSLEWDAYRITRDTLKAMARAGVFQAIGSDTIRGVNEAGIIGRICQKETPEKGQGDRGESNLPLPGIIVTYLGHRRPETAGDTCYDDGIITMLIQIVDRLAGLGDDHGVESYFRWMTDIRENLQANPYRAQGKPNGDMASVHVSDFVSPDNRAYIQDEARLVVQVSITARSRSNTGVKPHGT